MNHLWNRPAIAFATALIIGSSLVASAQTGSSVSSASALSGARQANGQGFEGGVPKVFAPTMPRVSYSVYPWKTDIVATVFWVGEEPTENNPRTNTKSSWDPLWKVNFGGYDDPDATKRTPNYIPAAFTPKQNPFYIALPYNDVENGNTKPEASIKIPWFKQRYAGKGKSVVRGQWLAIRYGNRVCYAQWEDVGPFEIDDVDYVFGPARPKNNKNNGAGIDISPAVRDYLGIKGGGKVDWRFVDLNEIPDGPWRWFGTNNPFIKARSTEKAQLQNRLEELRRMRDEYFRQNGSSGLRAR
jgi:hypothetical protein